MCVSLPSSLAGTSHPLLNREWDLFYPWYILLQLFWGIWQATGFVCLFCNWPPNWTRSSAGRDPFPVAFLECLISVSFCGSSVFVEKLGGGEADWPSPLLLLRPQPGNEILHPLWAFRDPSPSKIFFCEGACFTSVGILVRSYRMYFISSWKHTAFKTKPSQWVQPQECCFSHTLDT